MNIENIIQTFLSKNPRKRFPDKTWKICNPEKYLAAVKLYGMGYSISDIANTLDALTTLLERHL